MTRSAVLLATLLAVAFAAGCGKYGPPVRAGAGAEAGPSHAAATCEDPEHEHAGETTP